MNQAEIPATGSSSRAMARAHSTLGEKPIFSKSILSPPPSVSPDPVYISSSAASQWVSAELDDDDLSVSEAALSLLNAFLDQVLFSFLSIARSTRLPQLRQAIPEVLKPRLGKEAMASADEELREYLGDGDDEELSDFNDAQEPATEFDLDLAWKLARLRCMVYTRLGDLEEEDALEIIEREQLDKRGAQQRQFSSSSSSITPAGAIFLTSIIEYLGEQALYHAGIFAQTRASNVHPPVHEGSADAAGFPPRPSRNTIEEMDVRRLGSEGPLARIWRNWRRPVRSPQESFSQPISPSDDGDPSSLSGSPRQPAASIVGIVPLPTIAQTIHSDDPAQIPLPLSENDVDEIEVPGLAREVDDGEIAGSDETQLVHRAKRSNSMTFLPHNVEQPLTPSSVYMPSDVPPRNPLRLAFNRQRSRSLPIPSTSPSAAMRENLEINGEPILPTESDKLDDEEGNFEAIENATARGERPSRRHGLVIDALPGQADTRGSQSTVVDDHLERRRAEPAVTSREAGADGVLHRPAAEDQAAVTEASIHDASDFTNMHLPMRRDTSITWSTQTPDTGSDPEDLALSSADDEPPPTKPRLKHDSVPPIQMGSSSYTYSTQPGDKYIPRPVLNDAPNARAHHDVAAVAPPPRQINHTDSKAGRGIAAPTRRDPRFSTEDQYYTAQSSPNLPNSMGQIDMSAAATRGSIPQSTLARNAAPELSQHSSDPMNSGKPLGYKRDDEGRPRPSTANGYDLQRTAVASSPRAVNGNWHSPPTSTGAANDMRPATAGSPQPPAEQPLRLRSSSTYSGEAPMRTSFESDARKRSLELLIRGDETLHYTLTPTSARAPEFPDSIRLIMAEDAGDYGTNVASSDQQPIQNTAQQSVGSIRPTNGLRAHPPNEEFAPQMSAAASLPPATSPRVASNRPGTSASKTRHAEPRDAKVEPGTSRDLADYLRSTGPESDQQLPRAVISRLTPLVSQPPLSPRSAAQYRRNVEQSRTATKASGQAPVAGGRPLTAATSRPSGAPRYVPRDAQVSNSATTSALADFIREGPPRAAGDHRIPRTVAPFRTTRDSDDLNGLVSTDKDQPGRSSEASTQKSSAASTQNSSAVSQLAQSSTSSHAALLDRAKRTKPGPSANGMRTGTVTISLSQSTARDAVPKRKQRRVRDPYGIEDSDDDQVEVATLKPKREESLIDFLRNTAPQPSMTAQPIVSAGSSAAPRQTLQKKNSSSAIRDRIRNTTIPGKNRKNSTATELPAYSRGSTARAESPHLSQSGSKLDSYKPTQPTHAAHIDRVRSSRINGLLSKSEEYLPNNEQYRAARSVNTTKDESGFMAFFSRKKSIRK